LVLSTRISAKALDQTSEVELFAAKDGYMAPTLARASGRFGRWLLVWFAPALGVGLLVAGVFLLGKIARDHLRGLDRYTIAFAEIDCTPPAGQTRADFLDEVQYLTDLPDQLRLLDDDLPARLAEAFARHPWVEKVERVEIIPPRQVRVRLSYRTPVLAVKVAGQTRAVDVHGILLPATAVTRGLPVFPGQAPPPAGPAGTRWGDAAVEAAARAALKPR
jgi:hypothetical protein